MDNIIEPCCAERQVCSLLRENRGHAVLFQTNGDVTLAKWMQAIMLLSGSDRPRTMTLWTTEPVTAALLKPMAKYLRMEWIAKLRLMTSQPLTAADIGRMAAMADCQPEVLLQRMELAADETLKDGLLQFDGIDGTVIIQGRFLPAIEPSLMLYAGTFGGTNSATVRTFTNATDTRFRARRYEVDLSADAGSTEAPDASDSAPANPSVQSAGVLAPANPSSSPVQSPDSATPVQSAGVLASTTKKKPRTRKTKKANESTK